MPIYQFKLLDLTVYENGFMKEGSSHNLLSLRLIYPNEDNISLETVKKLTLKDRSKVTFSKLKFEDQIAFKQRIIGDCEIVVSLFAKENISKIEKLVGDIVRKGAIAATKLLTGGTVSTIIAGASKKVLESAFETSSEGKSLTNIGEGRLPLDDKMEDQVLHISLKVNKKVVLSQKRRPDKKIIEQKILPRGITNAILKLQVLRIGE